MLHRWYQSIVLFFEQLYSHLYQKCFPYTPYTPYTPFGGQGPYTVSKKDVGILEMEPMPIKVMVPVEIDKEWDSISADDVEARFGAYIMYDLMGDYLLLSVVEYPKDREFEWFVDNNNTTLMASYKGRRFLCNPSSEEEEWIELLS